MTDTFQEEQQKFETEVQLGDDARSTPPLTSAELSKEIPESFDEEIVGTVGILPEEQVTTVTDSQCADNRSEHVDLPVHTTSTLLQNIEQSNLPATEMVSSELTTAASQRDPEAAPEAIVQAPEDESDCDSIFGTSSTSPLQEENGAEAAVTAAPSEPSELLFTNTSSAKPGFQIPGLTLTNDDSATNTSNEAGKPFTFDFRGKGTVNVPAFSQIPQPPPSRLPRLRNTTKITSRAKNDSQLHPNRPTSEMKVDLTATETPTVGRYDLPTSQEEDAKVMAWQRQQGFRTPRKAVSRKSMLKTDKLITEYAQLSQADNTGELREIPSASEKIFSVAPSTGTLVTSTSTPTAAPPISFDFGTVKSPFFATEPEETNEARSATHSIALEEQPARPKEKSSIFKSGAIVPHEPKCSRVPDIDGRDDSN